MNPSRHGPSTDAPRPPAPGCRRGPRAGPGDAGRGLRLGPGYSILIALSECPVRPVPCGHAGMYGRHRPWWPRPGSPAGVGASHAPAATMLRRPVDLRRYRRMLSERQPTDRTTPHDPSKAGEVRSTTGPGAAAQPRAAGPAGAGGGSIRLPCQRLLPRSDRLGRSRELVEIFEALRAIPHVRVIRLGSKMPAFDPYRILNDPDLQAAFRTYSTSQQRIYLMAHFDHPREPTEVAIRGLEACLRNGVISVNQCPLIKGVNDDPRVLAEMYATLSYIGCTPYYCSRVDPRRATSRTSSRSSRAGRSSSRRSGPGPGRPAAPVTACRTKRAR